ncbi:hypothetical protein CRUP_023999 [Coryphaenoides rupestris]|nr:hypothetical protein CRUP_023999 [Coryphaenoides rupestris]
MSLNHHGLGPLGCKALAIALVTDMNIGTLELADNHILAEGAEHLVNVLKANVTIHTMDLSDNHLQSAANNEGLETLDLSWNHLRMKGAVAFSAGLKGALALGEALKYNNTLVHLNLNNNRITNEGVGMLCKGLEFNDTLRVLLNVLVNENFVHLLELTCQENPSLEVQYGGVGGFIAKKPPKRLDPMKVIQDYLDQRKLRLWDFFRNIDKDGTMRVPVADFRKAVQVQSSIPLERYQIEELIQRLDRERTGMVDYRGLADTRKQMMKDHRRLLRKTESRQKKEKQKSDRILKTFQSAVEAVTPRESMVMSPGGAKEDSSGPQHFSATPLSSWHHIVMSNSSRYSVTNLSSEHVHQPHHHHQHQHQHQQRPTSSPAMRSYSQPNLLDDSPHSVPGKTVSAQGTHSDPEGDVGKLCTTANHLTRSRPALNNQQSAGKRNTGKVKRKKSKRRLEKKSEEPKDT